MGRGQTDSNAVGEPRSRADVIAAAENLASTVSQRPLTVGEAVEAVDTILAAASYATQLRTLLDAASLWVDGAAADSADEPESQTHQRATELYKQIVELLGHDPVERRRQHPASKPSSATEPDAIALAREYRATGMLPESEDECWRLIVGLLEAYEQKPAR